jgi:hypothetical protein
MVPVAMASVVGLGLVTVEAVTRTLGDWAFFVGGILAGVGGVIVGIAVALSQRPRLAYESGCLLVYLRPGPPFRVPVEHVEAFLLGQGPSWLPGEKHRRTETVTLVVRLAEKAEEWSHRDGDPRLGSWCDGYITIRGTWCQPLTLDVVVRLNRRLADVQRTFRRPMAKVDPTTNESPMTNEGAAKEGAAP